MTFTSPADEPSPVHPSLVTRTPAEWQFHFDLMTLAALFTDEALGHPVGHLTIEQYRAEVIAFATAYFGYAPDDAAVVRGVADVPDLSQRPLTVQLSCELVPAVSPGASPTRCSHNAASAVQ